MIYHIQTFCTYGYWPDTDLKPKSHKPIIAACNKCGKIRVTSKKDYSSLCQSCANKKRFEDPEERKKSSESQNKRYEDPEERKKTSEATKKSYQNDLTRSQRQGNAIKEAHKNDPTISQHQSESHKKHYAEMDDPGLETVNHHIAYDFDHPEDLTVQITRRFHGSIHNPKGVQRHLRGYSLID